VNVVGQIFFIDYFLGFEFTSYGFDVLYFSLMAPDDRVDPMRKVFPKVKGFLGTLSKSVRFKLCKSSKK
jgi:hypothetical protein